MSELFIKDNPDSETSDVLLFASGEDLDTGSCEEDAVVEFSAFDSEGNWIPLCKYGYNLNLEEATALRDFLNKAIKVAQCK